MQILDIAKKRYAAKVFDPSKTLSPETVEAVKELLRLGPSSVNSQPWHFILAETTAGKERIAKATEGLYAYNKPKVLNASHVVVFCNYKEVGEEFLGKLTDQEAADGRFRSETGRTEQHAKRSMYVNMHQKDLRDFPAWASRQVYLNAGAFLFGVAGLGVDAVPMEGFDAAILDREFGLAEKGLTSALLVAIGYHAADDFNAALPKSRLPFADLLTIV